MSLCPIKIKIDCPITYTPLPYPISLELLGEKKITLDSSLVNIAFLITLSLIANKMKLFLFWRVDKPKGKSISHWQADQSFKVAKKFKISQRPSSTKKKKKKAR